MIPKEWADKPRYVQAAREAVGDKRVWADSGFQELLATLVGDGDLAGEKEVPKSWVLEVSLLVKEARKKSRQEGEWTDIPARKRWIMLAGQALIAMHTLAATPTKSIAGYHGE